MLYKKKNEKTLSKKLFENPTSEYRGAPFWAWNTKLEQDKVARQIGYFQEMGFGGFHIHTRTGLQDPYMGETFMDMVSFSCREAKKREMQAFLYDEDRWASGPAGGEVTKEKKFRRKKLEMYTEDLGFDRKKEEALDLGEPYLLAVYDVVLDEKGYLSSFRRIEKSAVAEGVKWFAYCMIEEDREWWNGQAYVDTMDKEAVSRFIEITYDCYKAKVGEDFGGVIPSIFTDEPNVNEDNTTMAAVQAGGMFPLTPESREKQSYSWTRFFEEGYREMFGEDILDTLPLLIWKRKDGSDSLYKYRYFEFIAETFSKNYTGQLGAWCEKNNLALTGHFLNENDLIGQTTSCGEVMRNYGYMGLPGIDILCDAREYTTAKQAQSAVHQEGKEGMMSELYGVTGWEFDFRGHKMQGDWQAALGVSLRVPHLAWMSMKGGAKRDYPASIFYQAPWYREYRYIEDHFARVNTALTRGEPIVRIGVIHPIESYWVATGPMSQTGAVRDSLEKNFTDVTNWLLKNHMDFDFISEATLPRLRTADPLAVGKMKYEAIVIPANLSLRSTTISFLKAFKEAGGKVVFMGECPRYVDGALSDGAKEIFDDSISVGFGCAQLLESLQENREIRILNSKGQNESKVLYNYRKDGDVRWLFVATAEKFGENGHASAQNDVTNSEELTVTVKGIFHPVEYDTLTGKLRTAQYEHKNGNTLIRRSVFPCDSALFCLQDAPFEGCGEKAEYVPVKEMDLKKAVEYSTEEKNVLVLDQGEYRFDDGPWRACDEMLRISRIFRAEHNFPSDRLQPYTVKKNPVSHYITVRFTFESEIEVKEASLSTEDTENITVFFNGERVEKHMAGYFADEAFLKMRLPTIPVGENVLEITYPYTEITNLEWCQLHGDFGVKVIGCEKILTSPQKKLGFGSVVPQGLPFYGGNIDYSFDVDLEEDGAVELEASYFRGALVGVSLDGERCGSIALPPYRILLEDVKKGAHRVTLTLFGNRYNTFGSLHMVNEGEKWCGPAAWRTRDSNWSYEYNFHPMGILKSPVIRIFRKK